MNNLDGVKALGRIDSENRKVLEIRFEIGADCRHQS